MLIMLKDHPNILGRARSKGDIIENVPSYAGGVLVSSGVCAHYTAPTAESMAAKAAIAAEERRQEAKLAKSKKIAKNLEKEVEPKVKGKANEKEKAEDAKDEKDAKDETKAAEGDAQGDANDDDKK